MTAAPKALPDDLEGGLRRLRLGAMRRLAPELLVTAKTQRWTPEDFLRMLVETEIASRDASNARSRLKAASFPVRKTLEEFNVASSSVVAATFDYLASLEWIAAKENLCLVGPAARARAICWSRSATQRSTPATASATSRPRSWSRRSIACWPTTPSVASSRESSERT